MFGKLLQQKRFLLKMHKNAFGDRAPLHPDPLAGSGGREEPRREGKGLGGEGKESSAIVLTGSSQIRHRYTVVPLATVTMSR